MPRAFFESQLHRVFTGYPIVWVHRTDNPIPMRSHIFHLYGLATLIASGVVLASIPEAHASGAMPPKTHVQTVCAPRHASHETPPEGFPEKHDEPEDDSEAYKFAAEKLNEVLSKRLNGHS